MFLYHQMPIEAIPMDGTYMGSEALGAGYVLCQLPPSMPMGVMMPGGSKQDVGMPATMLPSGTHAPPGRFTAGAGLSATATPPGGDLGMDTGAHSRPEVCLPRKTKAESAEKVQKDNMAELQKAFLQPLSSEKGRLAARALAKQVEIARRVKAKSTLFSALNIEVVRQAREGRCEKPLPPSEAAAEGVCEASKSMSGRLEAKKKGKQGVKNVGRQFSVMSQDTALPDSDGKDSESSSPSMFTDELEELSPAEAPAEAKPSFAEVRGYLLGFRSFVDRSAPEELNGLSALDCEPRTPVVKQQLRAPAPRSSPKPTTKADAVSPAEIPSRAQRFGLGRSRSQVEDLKRNVQSLLNKVCPENVHTIVEKIGAIDVRDLEQLETIIELIFRKALAEPHYCETYADMVFGLRSVFPEFPSPDSGKPITFKSSVLNICQNEFEELLMIIKPNGDDEAQSNAEMELKRATVAGRMRANMKFIGHLFLRKLLSAKVIGSVLCELVLCEFLDYLPEENGIECACELLIAVGFTLETMPGGEDAVQQVCGRLLDLKTRKTSDGKAAYCKRIQFMIQDVLDARSAGWARKLFKSSAKTKEEIRLEQERDMVASRSRGNTMVAASAEEHVVAGLRPQYLETATPGI